MKSKKPKPTVSSNGIRNAGTFKAKKSNTEWKKIKLAGKLISDDGGVGLEGLLGLEVLEDYGGMSITKTKFEKVKVFILQFEINELDFSRILLICRELSTRIRNKKIIYSMTKMLKAVKSRKRRKK